MCVTMFKLQAFKTFAGGSGYLAAADKAHPQL